MMIEIVLNEGAVSIDEVVFSKLEPLPLEDLQRFACLCSGKCWTVSSRSVDVENSRISKNMFAKNQNFLIKTQNKFHHLFSCSNYPCSSENIFVIYLPELQPYLYTCNCNMFDHKLLNTSKGANGATRQLLQQRTTFEKH